MKKISAMIMVGFLCCSMFSIFCPKASASSDLLSLPAAPYGWQYSDSSHNTLMINPLAGPLVSVSEQSISASPGQTVSISVTYQVFSQSPPNNPNEIDQLFFVESWTTSWPPQGYTIPLYNGIPGLSPGVTQTNTISFTVPTVSGTYYLWLCFEAQYSMQDAINQRALPMNGLPGHIKIVVGEQSRILLMDGFPLGPLDRGTGQSFWDYDWSFPNGSKFTVRGFLQSKGFSVDVSSQVLGSNPVTLAVLSGYDVVILSATYFDIPANVPYQGVFVDYVSQGGGLLLLGQADVSWVTLDEALGFHFVTIQWWNYYVDAHMTDPSHPIMSGISELPKAGGVFVDWDTLIADSPLPPNAAVLARSVGSGGMYDPDNVIALIAFQHGQGKVIVGPLDGMMRPYGPTAVDGYDVISEPVKENKLLVNAIRWVARMTQPDFEISVTPDIQTAQPDSPVYFQISVTSTNDFNSPVTLTASVSPYPVHIGWTIDPAVVTPPPSGQAFSALRVNVYEDTPLKTLTVTVTGTNEGIPSTDFVEVDVRRSLNVPYQSQGNPKWCVPTSLSMVLNYYGVVFHSWDYAKDENLRGDMGVDHVTDLIPYVKGKFGKPPFSLETESTIYSQDSATKLVDIQGNITRGYPVICELRPLDESLEGHAVVVTGFNETGIFVNDPSGALFDPASYFLKWSKVPASNIQAYAPWDETNQYVSRSLVIKGNPNPLSGCLDTYVNGMRFTNSTGDDVGCINLWGGLVWSPRVVTTKPDFTFHYSVDMCNAKSFSQTFTMWVSMIGHNTKAGGYTTFYSRSFQENLPAYSMKHVDEDFTLGDFLSDKVHYYHVKVQLRNSDGNVVDWFATGIEGESDSYVYYLKTGVASQLKESQRHLYLHVYDGQGNHVGLDYATGQPELEIPGSCYYDDGAGTIVIVVPEIMALTMVVDATYAQDAVESYVLTVTLNTELGTFEQTYSGDIATGKSQTFTSVASESGVELYAWQYVFKDQKRGTELRINADDKYFQFVAPCKDFGVKYDLKMKVLNHVITICYQDSRMCLAAIAIDDRIDSCVATAYDKLTRKTYVLIDIPNRR